MFAPTVSPSAYLLPLSLLLSWSLLLFFSALCLEPYSFVLVIIYDTTYTTHAFTAAPRDETARPPATAQTTTTRDVEEAVGVSRLAVPENSRRRRTWRRRHQDIPRKREGQHLAKALLSALHTSSSTPYYTGTQHHHNRNNAQHPISHYDHDGQHLLPAAGSRDVDGHGNGHSAELLLLLAGRHPQPCPRILRQLGIFCAQKKGKSLSCVSRARRRAARFVNV